MFTHIQKFAAAAVFLATAVASPAFAQEDQRPSFWVENESIDLGKVVAGRTVSATFVFHNDGDAEVRIISAAPS